MIYGDYARMGERAQERRERRRAQESKDPAIIKRWERVPPAIVKEGVALGTGSRNAGRLAGGGVDIALEMHPKTKKKVAETTRDVAHEGGASVAGTLLGILLLPLAPVLIYQAYQESKKTEAELNKKYGIK